MLCLVGGDAAAGGWPSRIYPLSPVTLALQSGTAPTYSQPSPYLGSIDAGVLFNSGGYFSATDTSLCDIGTEDIALELVCAVSPNNGKMIVSKRQPTVLGGWWAYSSSGVLFFGVRTNGAGSDTTLQSVVVGTTNPIVHAMAFVNADEASTYGSRWVVDGVASGGTNYSAVGTLSNDGYLNVGAQMGNPTGGVSQNDRALYLAIVWKFANWFAAGAASPTEWAEIAAQRSAILHGAQPIISWSNNLRPVACGSSSVAHQRKVTGGVSRLHVMGAGAPRFERIVDSAGREFTGCLVEPGWTNLGYPSTALVGTEASNNTLTSAAALAPDGTMSMTRLVEKTSAVSAKGRYYSPATAIALNDIFSVSGYVKSASDRMAMVGLMCGAHGVAFGVIIDPVTGNVGTPAPVHHSIEAGYGAERLDSGLWRVYGRIKCTLAACATMYPFYGLASDLTTWSFAGDATAHPNGALFWGVQINKAVESYPSSLIATTAASVTRAADVLRYDLTNLIGTAQGAVRFRFWCPATPSALKMILSLDDGTADNRIEAGILDDGTLYAASRRAGGTNGDCPPMAVTMGYIHEAMISWRYDRLDLWCDGVLSTDTVATLPTAITSLRIGTSYANASQFGPGLVGDIKVFNRYLSSWYDRGSGFVVMP